MEPLDLTKQPPRSPREKLDGLLFLARTIDKLRASLPGGALGEYKITGFSTTMLEMLGVQEADIRQAVARASSDDDVARWLRRHADTSQYPKWNAWILGRVIDDGNRERLHTRYPVSKDDPRLVQVVDILEADDRACFAIS